LTADYSRERALEMMSRGSIRPLDRIIDDLVQPFDSLERLTFALCEFITRRPLLRFTGFAHKDSAIHRLAQRVAGEIDAGFIRELVSKPVKHTSFRFKVICLYEEDYGDTREVFEFLAAQRGLDGVAYLDKLVRSVARIAGRPEWVSDPKTMFDGSFLAQLKTLQAEGVRFKELSGLTHTALKLYEWAFTEPVCRRNGFAEIAGERYDIGYDLGGGFTTQYLADRYQQPLICLDLFDPKTRAPHERKLVKKQYADVGLEFDAERIPFQEFDVYKHDYPLDHERYLITSFGFLGSTPGDLVGGRQAKTEPFSFSTIYAATTGICRLIEARKRVTLSVYGRPSATRFANLCYSLWFEDRTCTKVRSVTNDCYMEFWILDQLLEDKDDRFGAVTRG
jgi:hypothetical protein